MPYTFEAKLVEAGKKNPRALTHSPLTETWFILRKLGKLVS